jgi:hypothetical protein
MEEPVVKPWLGWKPLLEFTSWQVMEQLLAIRHVLPHDPSHCRSTVRILVKKHPSGQITTLITIKQEIVRKQQVIQKCLSLDFPRDLDLARGFESKLFIILVLARKLFSQWSDLHTSTSICPRTARLSPKKFLDDKQIFHLEILQNIILKVFPYLDNDSLGDLLRSCPRVSVIW